VGDTVAQGCLGTDSCKLGRSAEALWSNQFQGTMALDANAYDDTDADVDPYGYFYAYHYADADVYFDAYGDTSA